MIAIDQAVIRELEVTVEKHWNVATLLHHLNRAKQKLNGKGKVSTQEKIHLFALLNGWSPEKMAEKLGKEQNGIVTDLCRTLYRYVEQLPLGTDRSKKIENWRDVRLHLWDLGYSHQIKVEPEDLIRLNKVCTQIAWKARSSPEQFLETLQNLFEISRKYERYCDDELAINDFNHCARVVATLTTLSSSQQFSSEVITLIQNFNADLPGWLEETYGLCAEELWARERSAYYLELFKEYEEAGRVSESLAKLTQKCGKPDFLISAFYARAAHCYRQIGDQRNASRCFIQAANLLGQDGRVSKKALGCYQAAIELDPSLSSNPGIHAEQRRLSVALKKLEKLEDQVAIVANSFDEDLADILIQTLAVKRGIHARFQNAAEIQDLKELPNSYPTVIIVGGIKAVYTDQLLHRYFYRSKSRKGYVFEKLDVEGQRYSDFWKGRREGKLTYVLAGSRREETGQAILDFIDSDDFNQFAVQPKAGAIAQKLCVDRAEE